MYNYLINIPFIYFVTECMTTSAPRDKGRYKIITFCSAVKLIQTKWLEISYVITETKVKIGFSFQIKAGQFGIFLMTVEGGDWVSNPLLGVWNFALKGFLWVLNKEMALIFLWKEGERGRVRFWGIKSQLIHQLTPGVFESHLYQSKRVRVIFK